MKTKKYNLITPEGTRDLLFEECTARREIEKRLMSLFKREGFHEVITPLVEFYDVFERFYPQECMYKLTDSKGRLLVIRPDSTLPIVRLSETRLKNEPRPLKLCYNQTIYRANPKEAGRDDEIAQCGVEVIGYGDAESAQKQLLELAQEALELMDTEYLFEVAEEDNRRYYTGMMFNGYVDGFGKPVLSGGVYKVNDTAGIGFGVNVSAFTRIWSKKKGRKGG